MNIDSSKEIQFNHGWSATVGQQQLGRMADFLPPVTFLVFDLQNYEVPQI